MDYTINHLNSAHAFLDDIIIITKGTLNDHETEIKKVLTRLDKENLPISLLKCEFAQTEIVWLGYKISPDGITPIETKTNAFTQKEQPYTLIQLRSTMGSTNHMIKFEPNLSNITAPLRALLSANNSIKGSKLKWSDEHDAAFNEVL